MLVMSHVRSALCTLQQQCVKSIIDHLLLSAIFGNSENIVQPMTLKVFPVLFFLIRHFIELVKQAVPTPTFMNVVEKRKNSSDPGSELNTVD